MSSSHSEPVEPRSESRKREPEEGIGLCLSGGGYRAMLFHVGSLWRLYEAEILGNVKRISSVSGGSITAGVLGMKWSQLSFHPAKINHDFVPLVVGPIRHMADRTIDVTSIIGGALLPGSAADKLADAYKKFLFGDSTLQDLPDEPRFVINATNVQSGALWRFMKPYMRDWRVGEVKNPTVPLSVAVAASSAFPPVLSPLILELDDTDFTPRTGRDLQRKPFTTDVVLSDGGDYDNLGLETVWKRYSTVLVSDGGGKLQPDGAPGNDWVRHGKRVIDIVLDQLVNMRKRQLIGSFEEGLREGTYWGVRSDISDYGIDDALPCPLDRTTELAGVPTRLKWLTDRTQERLINWGYAVCDAAIRKHVVPSLDKPYSFPYPESAV